ncbi:MAG TPA: Rrf2 family transcriptional regulator [Gammaproteobacteria bacterium]|nr:Rrf2 family transcriptional regulator [Gammaproteobacteria bacterium]
MSYSLSFSKAVLTAVFIGDKIRQQHFDYIPSKHISEMLGMAPATTVKVLRALNQKGIIETREGARGGVRLARKPRDITVLDVFEAIEQGNPLFHTNFGIKATGERPTRAQQAILDLFRDAEQTMHERLRAVTLEQLLQATDGASGTTGA